MIDKKDYSYTFQVLVVVDVIRDNIENLLVTEEVTHKLNLLCVALVHAAKKYMGGSNSIYMD